jgi:hypothetical protein
MQGIQLPYNSMEAAIVRCFQDGFGNTEHFIEKMSSNKDTGKLLESYEKFVIYNSMIM